MITTLGCSIDQFTAIASRIAIAALKIMQAHGVKKRLIDLGVFFSVFCFSLPLPTIGSHRHQDVI